MKIKKISDVDGCLDGLIMKKVGFDQPVDEKFYAFMGQFGELEYHPDFARPYFRVDVEKSFVLKGVEGNSEITLILSRENPDKSITHFKNLLEDYQSSKIGIAE
ncbi:MAG: hypothetical protein GF310_06500 [candidate division Zixibacteria bacterium]|nr:hypothetical protein [candidate division Zixibacteria bacterium]